MPRTLKWIGISPGGLLALLGVAAFVHLMVGRTRLSRRYQPPPCLSVASRTGLSWNSWLRSGPASRQVAETSATGCPRSGYNT